MTIHHRPGDPRNDDASRLWAAVNRSGPRRDPLESAQLTIALALVAAFIFGCIAGTIITAYILGAMQ
jgi:hypothetical protein